jgi:quaternary ammonium compound-resistance protein SugE
MIYWLYLIVAAVFETCWLYSLKFLDMKQVTAVRPALLMQDTGLWKVFLPLTGYIVFGLCNIYFFSSAMKGIQASTAFAVWMAVARIFAKAMDLLVFGEPLNYPQLFFMTLLLVGIIGLKYYSRN